MGEVSSTKVYSKANHKVPYSGTLACLKYLYMYE